ILAPHQVEQAPADGSAGRYRTSGGRSIALFVYDGAISHDVAFGSLLKDASAWAERLLAPGKRGHERRLVAVATDGETYGHHHKFGEVALAWVLRELERRRDARVENFAAFLARHRPEQEVKLVAPTSWSCVHGVARWRGARHRAGGCRRAATRGGRARATGARPEQRARGGDRARRLSEPRQAARPGRVGSADGCPCR